MRMQVLKAVTLVILVLLAVMPAVAQEEADLFAQVRGYYQGEAYDKAEEALGRIIAEHPENAQAHYLLSRLYFNSPLQDIDRAARELHRALELDPDNVQYMVARLQFLRREAGNFVIERIRDMKRRRLAHEILALDSTNAVAHEELGITYIHDFWRYRNAMSLPFVNQRSPARVSHDGRPPADDAQELRAGTDPQQSGSRRIDLSSGREVASVELPAPGEIFVTDDYDLEHMRRQGVMVQDLSSRGEYAYDQAVEHLEKALKYDPRRRSVYDHLMQIHVLRETPATALEMLRSMYVQFPEDPALWLYLGYAHFRTHNLEAAAESFRQAFEHMEPAAYEAYHALDILLPDEESQQYSEDPAAYAERYWTSKDPRYLTPHNERRLEHYARMVYADLLYAAPDIDKRGWETQRGRILVRYGVPPVDVVLMKSGTSNLSDDAPVGASDAAQGGLGNTLNIWDYGDFKFVFEDPFRNGEYRLYSPSATDIAEGQTLPFENDYVLKAKETFREVPERYDYEPPGREVDLPYLVNTFKGEDGKTDVYVHYGVPIADAAPEGETVGVTMKVGTFLIGEDRHILAEQKNTIYGLRPAKIQRFRDVRLWTDTKMMRARPGEHELSMEFEASGGSAVGVQRRDITVPSYESGDLAISNVLLAYGIESTPDGKPRSAGEIARNGLSIRPAPWSVFSSDQPIYIYFELYNLQTGEAGQTRYDVEALLVPKDKSTGIVKFFENMFGGQEGVSVQYEGTGTAPDASQYLILDAQGREPGLYTLVVQIHDTLTGQTAQTKRDLYLE